jgi:lysosomal Pro-X carboxypeptidase
MVNYPYESTFLAPLPAYPVREFCGRLEKPLPDGKELLDGLQLALSVYTNYTGKTKCVDISSAYDASMGDKGWNFQACTEMVMPMCSTGQTDMFPAENWDLKKYSDECFTKFGVRPRPNAAQMFYGGAKLESASNIVFSNGLLDPWSGGGVLRTRNDRIDIRIIPDGAHHIDLRASNLNDPGSVIEVRKSHVATIRKWLREFHKKKNYVNPIFVL